MIDPPGEVRRVATGNDQPGTAPGALGIESDHALNPFFSSSSPVHRPHQGTVLQGREAEVEQGEQVRVGVWLGWGLSRLGWLVHESGSPDCLIIN